MTERKEILALNRHRYDELVQMTNKALMVTIFIHNANLSSYILISFMNKQRTLFNNFDQHVHRVQH